MAEFWEQQMMDRLLALAFEFRQNEKFVIPHDRVKDVLDYVKFLLQERKTPQE